MYPFFFSLLRIYTMMKCMTDDVSCSVKVKTIINVKFLLLLLRVQNPMLLHLLQRFICSALARPLLQKSTDNNNNNNKRHQRKHTHTEKNK